MQKLQKIKVITLNLPTLQEYESWTIILRHMNIVTMIEWYCSFTDSG